MKARILLVVTAVALTVLAPAGTSVADHTTTPSSVTVAGSLQDELGCPGDWQPECAATHLGYDVDDDVWQGIFTLPAGSWEYKAALNDAWDESYGTSDGGNIALETVADTDVKFYYSHNSHWATDNFSSVIATLAGSMQDELGCPGDWSPDCLRTWLQDADGDGIFTFITNALPAGDYETKVAINESWDESYGTPEGDNVPFSVPEGATTTFTYDAVTHAIDITSITPGSPVALVGDLQTEVGCPADWAPECDESELDEDAEDGIFRTTFPIPAGDWEYKVALNDAWDESYGTPDGGNIALSLAADTDVRFYYSPVTKWVTDDVNSRIVTAAGSFQAALGCPGDWQPDCLLSWLEDADGDGIYVFATDAIPAGDYEVKAALSEGWDESYGTPDGSNIAFTSNGEAVTFSFDSATNTLTVEADAAPGIDNNVHWDDLGHNSRDPLYRQGGDTAGGSDGLLRLRAQSGDLETATVRLFNDRLNAQTLLAMTKVYDDGTFEWWEATFDVGDLPTVWWYRFIARDGDAVAYYEDDAARTGGWGETFGDSPDNSWQLTTADPDFATPDWVKNAVIYQIFPDRFRDGDSANNTPEGDFFYEERMTEERSGGEDWNTPICEPRAEGDTVVDAHLADCGLLYSQNFYGGDLQGVIDQLDYLDDLGVTALYLNPIFESPSNHRYDTTDFLQIEDSLGDLDTFIALSEAAGDRGMRIILDGVFNHSSSDSIYFDRYSRYDSVGACESEASDYRDWYFFSGEGPCAGDVDYEAWFGFDSLPKLDSANADVRDLIYASGADAVATYWLQWADGWRLDVAGDIDPGTTADPTNDYWEEFRAAVRAANPDTYIVGEEWGIATSWTLGEEWDATMNYQFASAVLGFWRDTSFTDNDHNASSSAGIIDPLAPSQLWERLANLEERYPAEAYQAMMNLLGSHDTNRALFMLDHNAATGSDDTLLDDPNYDWSDALQRLQGVAVLQMTLPGAPTIYYGDEIGLVGPTTFDGVVYQDDPYNRIPYPWLDESGTPFYSHLQSAEAQADMYDHYAALAAARNAHPALRTGSLDLLAADDDAGLLAYGRWIDDKRPEHLQGRGRPVADAAVVVVNRGDAGVKSVDVTGYLSTGSRLRDVLGGGTIRVSSSGVLSVYVEANSSVVLVATGRVRSRPAAPAGVAVIAERAGELDLAWTAVSGREYDVWRTPLSGGGYELVGTTTAGSFTDTGLVNAVEYHYVVVARDLTGKLVSAYSAEVSGVPHYDIGWANLQWPPDLVHVISTITPAGPVYGQIWIDGVTSSPGATPSVMAELGFGVDGSTPDDSWAWSVMGFNTDVGDNDEFVGTMWPDAIGEYDYAVRYSTDGGRTWLVSDTTGPSYASETAGQMSVIASDDVTAPSVPVLESTGANASSISLSWTASTDDVAVAGYELFRDGVEIAELSGTTYVDAQVATGASHTYEVRAFDTSWNRSAFSNSVYATAAAVQVEVTFVVTVGENTTGSVYIAGSFPSPFPAWDPGGLVLASTANPNEWSVTLTMQEGTALEYKYTRGTWEAVEKGTDCEEIANRALTVVDDGGGTMTVGDVVAKWRDLDGCP